MRAISRFTHLLSRRPRDYPTNVIFPSTGRNTSHHLVESLYKANDSGHFLHNASEETKYAMLHSNGRIGSEEVSEFSEDNAGDWFHFRSGSLNYNLLQTRHHCMILPGTPFTAVGSIRVQHCGKP